jgi:hypothetical protein
MDQQEYLRRLAERFNNPLRPQLSAVIEATRGIDDPNRAWEQLLHERLLPEAFIQDQRRRFAVNAEGQLIWPTDRLPEHLSPSSIGSVRTVASDPGGILEAEAQARELARRLVPWTAVCNDQVVWSVTDNPYKRHPYEVVYLGLPFNSAQDTVNWTLSHYGIEISPLGDDEGELTLPVIVRETLAAAAGWEIGASRGLEIREPRWPLDLSKWQSFSQLDNPFIPLLDLWCTGYRLACDFEEKDPTIRLYAKPLPLSA